MVLSIMFILAGAMGPAAALQWRQEKWLPAAEWIAAQVSPAGLVATPALGIFLAFVGVMLLWPPAVLLAFLSALGFLFVLVLATRERLSQRLFPAVGQGVVEPAEEEPSPARRKAS